MDLCSRKLKNLFKREEPKRDPRVSYAEVKRVPIKKFEPKKFEPKRFKTTEDKKIWRFRYTDTNEVRELPGRDAIDEIMNTSRPIRMEGFVD